VGETCLYKVDRVMASSLQSSQKADPSIGLVKTHSTNFHSLSAFIEHGSKNYASGQFLLNPGIRRVWGRRSQAEASAFALSPESDSVPPK
jgi:hypothetical protein